MRLVRFLMAAGLCLTPLLGLTAVRGSELGGVDPQSGKAPPPVRVALPAQPAAPEAKEADTCHGTAVEFVDSPKEAALLAQKQEKLVFVLHVSGHFEDPRFT